MGKSCFLKIINFFAIALLGVAAAIAAVAVLSTPATAQAPGGGGDSDDYPWDTDNLRYAAGRYSARSFNVPFHQYGGYREGACQGGVADAFFQAGGSVGAVNDFPYLDWVTDADGNESWAVQEGGTRSSGCDKFVKQQDEMAAQIVGNGGYYLDLSGNLKKLSDDPPSRFSGRSLVYGDWDSKGSGFAINSGTGELVAGRDGNGYRVRADGWKTSSGFHLAIYPAGATWTIPEGTQNGRFGGQQSWHGISYRRGSAVVTRVARPVGGVVSGGYLPNVPGLCPARFHPRGEDSVERIGSHTGRTLTGLTHARGKIADQYWCRSDLRFARAFETQNHGVALHRAAEGMTGAFQSYGRLNCYYTAFSVSSHASYTDGIRPASSGGMVCSYLFPIPRCDPDTDNDSDSDWRDYTAEELKDIADDLVSAKFNKDEGAACPEATPDDPDPQDPTPRNAASFNDPACVTAGLSIYENRTVGSDAAPGVPALDRTLAVAAGRTAWDLDITSPYHATASPPRRNGDATGCADGSEDRAYHSTLAGHANRKQSPAPSYAASDRDDDAAPPNDLDSDIDYSGAVKNMAHRYASRVAENTCAAKRAEASLRLALLEAEEKLYKDWMERYEAWAKGKKDAFGNWRPTNYPSGTNPNTSSSLSVHPTFYSFKHAKRSKSRLDYADAMSTMYQARETAAGEAAGRTLTKPTVGASWCGDPAGFVKTYSDSVTALKTTADNATTAGTAQTQPSKGPTSADTPNAGSIGVVDASKLSEGAARVPAEWGTSYTYAYTDSKGKRKSGSSGCWQAGTSPTFGAPAVTYTPGAACISKAAVPEVLASGTASSVTYASYTFVLSGGGWTRTITVPAATRTAVCSSWQTSSCVASPSTHPSHSGYVSRWNGNLPSVTDVPSTTGAPGKSVSSPALSKLLGKYNPSHADRANLKHPAAQTRNQAAADLGKLEKTTAATITPTAFSNLAVPASNPATDTEETTQRGAVETAAETYQNRYTQAYDNAYDQATEDMGGTTTTITRNGQTETVKVWSDFDWRYETSTLAWGGYQEDPATTYSASTATPRDGTGCDLISVASDGSVSVEATRLDYETSSYGKGSVYGTRTDAQRICKIRRTRTPELILEYQPSRPSGTDTSKAVSSFYVDYQPTAAAERFKLYDEAEVFAVKTSLADRAPVLCYQPGEALVAHVGARGIDAVNKAVFRNASGFRGGNKKHCYRPPSLEQLGSPPLPLPRPKPQPAFAFFDDTAHSAMASVNVVWQQPSTKIVPKLGSTDDLKMMANTVALVASPAVAYDDATRTSSFYGTYYTFPTDNSVNSPSGWDITGHPTLTLTSTFEQHQVQAKDTAAKTPATHTMVFKFIDCMFGIEDVAFVDNIASPYALLSDENGVVPSGWKQTYDSDPHNSPTWYYPAFSTYEGARRLDGRRDSNGDPITYGRNTQGGFAHPSYALENTASDGIGWGIVYEDKVGKQQPVWAVYAPPVPGDNTQTAIEVCGANNLGASGANPAAPLGGKATGG